MVKENLAESVNFADKKQIVKKSEEIEGQILQFDQNYKCILQRFRILFIFCILLVFASIIMYYYILQSISLIILGGTFIVFIVLVIRPKEIIKIPENFPQLESMTKSLVELKNAVIDETFQDSQGKFNKALDVALSNLNSHFTDSVKQIQTHTDQLEHVFLKEREEYHERDKVMAILYETFIKSRVKLQDFEYELQEMTFLNFRDSIQSHKSIPEIIEDFKHYISNMHGLSQIQFEYVFKFEDLQTSYAEIKKSNYNIADLTDLIKRHVLLKRENLDPEVLKSVLADCQEPTISVIKEQYEFIVKTRSDWGLFERYISELSGQGEHPLPLQKIIAEKARIIQLDKKEYWFWLILEAIPFKFFGESDKQINKLIQTLFGFLFFKTKFPEYFQPYCVRISEDERFLALLWSSLQKNPDIEQFLRQNLQDQHIWLHLLEEYDSDTENPSFLQIFKENLQAGEIVIKRRDLHAKYIHKFESKFGYLDYLFRTRGEINFKVIYDFIFEKTISDRNFRLLATSQTKLRPYLLTFSSGNTKSIDDILTDDVNDKTHFFCLNYTTTARMGVIPPDFRSMKEFGEDFRQRYEKNWYDARSRHFVELIEHLEKLGKKHIKPHLVEGEEERVESVIKEISQISARISEKISRNRFPYIELKDLSRFVDEVNGLPTLYKKVQPSIDILFHELIMEEEAFHTIDYAQKYDAVNHVKKVIARGSSFATLTAGLMFGDQSRGVGAAQTKNKIQSFLQNTDFDSLLISDDNNSLIKSYLSFREHLGEWIRTLFGKDGTDNFLKQLDHPQDSIANWGATIKSELNLKHRLSIDDYEQNIGNLRVVLAKYTQQLELYWKERCKPHKQALEEALARGEIEEDELKQLERFNSLIPDLAYYILNVLFYFTAVVTPDLELYEFPDASDEITGELEIIKSRYPIPFKKSEKNTHFDELMGIFLNFYYRFRVSPLYKEATIEEYKKLNEGEIEDKFQRLFDSFFGFRIGEIYFSREPKQPGSIVDFKAYGYPIECKVRKKADDVIQDFIDYHLTQITDYCTHHDKKLGFFVYYDNITLKGAELALNDNFSLLLGKVTQNIQQNPSLPTILIVRIPNWGRESSGKKLF